jgi:hypothetical protein
MLAKLDAEYGTDYANSHSIFVTSDTSLANLAFRFGATQSGKPIRAMIHQGNQFFEVNLTAAPGSAGASLVLKQPSALAAQGITVQSADGKPLSATLALGTNLGGVVNVQRTTSMNISGSVHATASQSKLLLSSGEALPPTAINEEELAPSGAQTKPVRPLNILRETQLQH